jgi:hypothetical protein
MATKFTAEFLERRMEQHRRWRHEVEYAMLEEILDEVQNLPARRPKSGRLFLELPEHMREGAAL